MKGTMRWVLPLSLMAGSLVLLGLYLRQPVTIILNGASLQVRTAALTVGGILRQAGLPPAAGDVVVPPSGTLLLENRAIHLNQSSKAIVWLQGERHETATTARYPANLLQDLGVRLFPSSQLVVDGEFVPAGAAFSPGRVHTVQLLARIPPVPFRSISVGDQLALAGSPLLGLDRSIPDESAPFSGQQGEVVRVQDSFEVRSRLLPYETQEMTDPQVELDQRTVSQQGENGLAVSATRIRSVEGQAASRTEVDLAVVRPPVDEIVSLGTKAVLKQTTVDGFSLEYWRSVSMYATTYSPGESGGSGTTYSGTPVTHGVAAVVRRWFPSMQGQRVYVSGYGYATIEDIGGGIPGKPWIDLGYEDANYIPWSGWVTVYFLAPIPADILYNLN